MLLLEIQFQSQFGQRDADFSAKFVKQLETDLDKEFVSVKLKNNEKKVKELVILKTIQY